MWWRKQKEVEAAVVLNPVLPRLSGGEDGQWNASREEKARDFLWRRFRGREGRREEEA